MEHILFRTGDRSSWLVVAPDGAFNSIVAADEAGRDWVAAALAVYDTAPEVWEQFNGKGACLPSSSRKLSDEKRRLRREYVEKGLKDGYLPILF